MTLNADQEKTTGSFLQFLFSDNKEFIITGPAGTGKTYLMDHLLKVTLPEFYGTSFLMGKPVPEYEIVLAATTNKAAEVLYLATGINACTIHSHMNLKMKDNYKTGKSDVIRTNAWKVHTNQLIFIDEASMTDRQLYDFILSGTDNTCKIVYLGDHCQMAPVFEKISPIYKNPRFVSELKTPVRNANQPALMALCSQLRNTVETLDFKQIREVPGVVDYVTPQQAYNFIDNTFNVEGPSARILCYTNSRVIDYNSYIRALRGYPPTFTVGECLVNNTTIAVGASLLRVEEEFKITRILTAPYSVKIDSNDPNSVMDVYDVEVMSNSTKVVFTLKLPASHDRFKQLIQYYSSQKNWNAYYDLKNTYPDMRQRDATTVYKSQGSTYDTVFLDLSNIGKCTHDDQLARMLYVGASRATTRLLLVGELPQRLFQQAA
jgi:hypothetical protein